jgi:peptidyl-prolyl cis-trans isomerase B (cyclophilin B)
MRVAKYLKVLFLCVIAILLLQSQGSSVQQKKRDAQPAQSPETINPQEAAQLEAVITTDLGVIRFEFFPEKAPKHTTEFIRLARSGFYDGSAFHRLLPRAIIQGGDPLLKDPQTPRARWGTGGFTKIPDELSDIKHVRGTVSTVGDPAQPSNGGAQFFICLYPQPQLDGHYSAFGQVTEGLDVAEKISVAPSDADHLSVTPVKIVSIKIERKKPEPFKDATVDQMRKDVLLRTSLGDITLEMNPDLAPEHVRNFLKLVESGWYDHTAFHRIVPGFVIQGGLGETRADNKPHPADKWVHKLKGEFSPTALHIRGVLSMARASDPDSAETSFFIVLGPAPHLDGKYTIFGKVVDGFDTLELIEKAPRNGETPVQRIELIEAGIKQ